MSQKTKVLSKRINYCSADSFLQAKFPDFQDFLESSCIHRTLPRGEYKRGGITFLMPDSPWELDRAIDAMNETDEKAKPAIKRLILFGVFDEEHVAKETIALSASGEGVKLVMDKKLSFVDEAGKSVELKSVGKSTFKRGDKTLQIRVLGYKGTTCPAAEDASKVAAPTEGGNYVRRNQDRVLHYEARVADYGANGFAYECVEQLVSLEQWFLHKKQGHRAMAIRELCSYDPFLSWILVFQPFSSQWSWVNRAEFREWLDFCDGMAWTRNPLKKFLSWGSGKPMDHISADGVDAFASGSGIDLLLDNENYFCEFRRRVYKSSRDLLLKEAWIRRFIPYVTATASAKSSVADRSQFQAHLMTYVAPAVSNLVSRPFKSKSELPAALITWVNCRVADAQERRFLAALGIIEKKSDGFDRRHSAGLERMRKLAKLIK